jgi:hypothetical protein
MYYGLEADAYNMMMHSGTKGQKWGRRRYQNKDGSLTPLGRIHYAKLKRQQAKEQTQQYKVYSTHEKRNASHYSVDELNEFRSRNNAEENFYKSENTLRSERAKYNDAYVHPAKKIAKKVINSMGNALLNDVAKPYAIYQIKKSINQMSGEKIYDLSGNSSNKKKKKNKGGNNNQND